MNMSLKCDTRLLQGCNYLEADDQTQKKHAVLISKHVSVKRPYSCHQKFRLEVLWCECIWQGLAHCAWTVVDCHNSFQTTAQPHRGRAVTNFLKAPYTDLFKGSSLWQVRGGKDSNITPFSLASSSTFPARCDWWLSRRSNTSLYFVT